MSETKTTAPTPKSRGREDQPGKRSNNILLDAALKYADEGWPVLPCRERGKNAKAPYLRNGFKGASTDPDQIRRWWKRWPSALIGVAVPAGVVVLDLDCPDALVDLERLNGGPLPATRTVQTGRGEYARHFYYKHLLPDMRLRGQPQWGNGKTLEGVDVKAGERGYLIAPPSLHPRTGKPYVWLNVGPLAPLPAPLAIAIQSRPQQRPSARGEAPGKGKSSCEGLLRTVRNAKEGERNRVLFWAACRMTEGELAGKAHDWAGLELAALDTGLFPAEIQATIRSATSTVEHDYQDGRRAA